MKTQKSSFKVSILALAIASVVPSMYAYADEEEAAALKYPTSSVQVEEIYVSQGSQKFGEYNGLNKQGGYLNGNINIIYTAGTAPCTNSVSHSIQVNTQAVATWTNPATLCQNASPVNLNLKLMENDIL